MLRLLLKVIGPIQVTNHGDPLSRTDSVNYAAEVYVTHTKAFILHQTHFFDLTSVVVTSSTKIGD